VNSSQWRGSFERLRLLLKIGGTPRSRVQQISTWVDRSSLALPIPWKVPPLDSSAPPPVVIGATGGSGTRVMAQVLQKAGWFMGNRLNPRNEDSLPIGVFLTKWLKKLKDFPNVDSRTLTRARREFQRMVHLHRRGISSPDARWGWKNPRSLWLIPFLVERFPEIKFIHMIRDARDMMLSENIYFLRQNGHWLLGPDWWRNPEAAQLELWRASNKRAVQFAQHYLKDRYHLVRYEDLCRKPAETVSAVMTFLGAPEINIEPLIEGIRDRGNIGRWRQAGAAKVIELGPGAQADLERFGYKG
jgi:Sulfotransferase family